MIAHGALFGVWVGALLSLTGSVGAALVGFAVGRRGGALVERLVSREERARVDLLLLRWGALAVVVTRPVPLLAETVAILAGASPLGWRRVMLAAVAGSLPGALLYALAGAMAADFQSGVLVLGLVLLVAAFFYVVSRWIGLRAAGS
jgi:3-dehydroquinate synthase